MWESKEQAIDVNYNADEFWFVGVYGQPVAKPNEIIKWEENSKFFKLLDKTYPRVKAVQQRLTFKPNLRERTLLPSCSNTTQTASSYLSCWTFAR
jgi:hypothetical protein